MEWRRLNAELPSCWQAPGSAPFCTTRSAVLTTDASDPPVAILTGVHDVSPCEPEATVSAEFSTGGGAFGLEFVWAVESASDVGGNGTATGGGASSFSTVALQDHLDRISMQNPRSTQIRIPTELLPAAPTAVYVYAQVTVDMHCRLMR